MSQHEQDSQAAARRPRGFTRHEMFQGVGALALLVLLAGVPQRGSEEERRLVQSQAHVSRAISVARELARETGRPHGVAFDVEQDRLAVVDPLGAVALNGETGAPLLAELDADLISARFGSSVDMLLVDPSGWPVSGGAVHLRAGPHVLELKLDAATGWLDAVGLAD